MSYEVELNKSVKKFLAKHEDIARIFYRKMKFLTSDPYENSLDIKPYKGRKNSFRLRIGKYRFLYEVIEDKVLIYFFDADGRGDIYK